MSEPSSSPPGTSGSGGARRGPIVAALAVLGVAAVVVAAVLLIGGDDESASETTTVPAATAGPGTTATSEPTDASPITDPASSLVFRVTDIDDGGTIPTAFTCDGDDIAPIVTIESVPDGVVQLAFVVDDPDAPRDDPFVHWVVYGIPGDATEITDGGDGLTSGTNDAGTDEWFGPCPPAGDGPHEYRFTMYALDRDLGLESGLDGRQVTAAIAVDTLVDARIVAVYERATG